MVCRAQDEIDCNGNLQDLKRSFRKPASSRVADAALADLGSQVYSCVRDGNRQHAM